MMRRSYYPQNQQIISTITATSSSGGFVASRPVTPATDSRIEGVGIVHDESEFDGDDVQLEKLHPREKSYS
jgi:serine/threonine kinase 32